MLLCRNTTLFDILHDSIAKRLLELGWKRDDWPRHKASFDAMIYQPRPLSERSEYSSLVVWTLYVHFLIAVTQFGTRFVPSL